MNETTEGVHRQRGDVDRAVRAVRRASIVALVSGVTLTALAGASALFGMLHPLSAGFLISIAVVANGVYEWRWSKRLAALDARAPLRLAWNQCALGLEIAVYSAWQYGTFDAEAIHRLLARPLVRPVLGMLEPEVGEMLLELLPTALRLFYGIVGVVALCGCGATAWYYRSRLAAVRVVRSAPPRLP
ncbi:hypothetical protein ASA1KI_25030 [Opitutales bacterium ASA1]|uniref:hypothetical protein n=1 Tax=Congregicoccus parvus TaxID=3081749 RepID=UPI002B29813B|nr:hypothetical protein ASA1KI_25030 [Opitutales bacterium ASA1]